MSRADEAAERPATPPWKVGDQVDVISPEGIYCPARILSITKSKKHTLQYHIRYLGWGHQYDETIDDPSRIWPSFTGVKLHKSWVKLADRYPYWPCVAYIRQPKVDDELAIQELKLENKVFITPCGTLNKFTQPYFHGVWIDTSRFESYSRGYTIRKAQGLQASLKGFAEEFETAVKDCDSRHEAQTSSFRFQGSFEENSYKRWRERQLRVQQHQELLRQPQQPPPPPPLPLPQQQLEQEQQQPSSRPSIPQLAPQSQVNAANGGKASTESFTVQPSSVDLTQPVACSSSRPDTARKRPRTDAATSSAEESGSTHTSSVSSQPSSEGVPSSDAPSPVTSSGVRRPRQEQSFMKFVTAVPEMCTSIDLYYESLQRAKAALQAKRVLPEGVRPLCVFHGTKMATLLPGEHPHPTPQRLSRSEPAPLGPSLTPPSGKLLRKSLCPRKFDVPVFLDARDVLGSTARCSPGNVPPQADQTPR